MATSQPTSVEDLRRRLDEAQDLAEQSAERNQLLTLTHPAYADQRTASEYQDRRFPSDGGIQRSPSPRERANTALRDGGGIVAQPRPDIDGGIGSGEGEATSDLQKAEVLRAEREHLELRAMRKFAEVRDQIEKSHLAPGGKAEMLDRLGRAQLSLEHSRAAQTSVGYQHAMSERAQAL